MRPNHSCIRLSQPNLIDHLKCPSGPNKKTRFSQPNLHIRTVKGPQSQSSIESQESMPSEGARSLTVGSTHTPPSQRSRYSQPNLPILLISSNDRRIGGSSDRRIRMSQPTLNSSFSGINFLGFNKGQFSYSSLRTSGDNSINFQIEEEGLSSPSVHSAGLPARGSRFFATDIPHPLRQDPHGRRERLSQPTLVTGDYHPARAQQRLSQPTLVTGDYYPGRTQHRLSQPSLNLGKEFPTLLQSPMKHKRFCPPMQVTQRDRLSQLDFGAAKCRNLKDFPASVAKFNRDRFSIPELQTSNDLRLMAGTPKQRFSLDSSISDPGRTRLLPIASSPIAENQIKSEHSETEEKSRNTAEGLGAVLVASTSPILPHPESVFSPPSTRPVQRERLSVTEIRNSSLRRLLDSPMKQRHSLTTNLRQCLLPVGKSNETGGLKPLKPKIEDEKQEKWLKDDLNNSLCSTENKEAPKHIQRHYSYTYDSKDETSILSKLNVCAVPRKKYLESNFDKNEQVITTVIETESPMFLSSPKYTKKTHAYSSEAPKWMKKYLDLENESPKIARKNLGNNLAKTKQENNWLKSNQGSFDSVDSERTHSEKTSSDKTHSYSSTGTENSSTTRSASIRMESMINATETFVKIESTKTKEEKHNVPVGSSWTGSGNCRLYHVECDDTDTDESTSV